MNSGNTNFGILFIDDEEKSLKYFDAIFSDLAPIYLARSPEEGFELFRRYHDKIAIVVSDKKMPGESGLSLLTRIRELDAKPLRFLITAYADLDLAVDSLNNGLLYTYLTKPWDPTDLEHRLSRALKHFRLEREREMLLHEKSIAFQQLLMADKAAGIGILSAGLNHHLRNALTVLRTFHDLLPYQLHEEVQGELKDPDFWEDSYREAGEQIERMTSILGNLSEGTEMSGLNLSDHIDFPELLHEARAIVSNDQKCPRFRMIVSHDVPKISGDRQKLSQMARFLFEEARTNLREENEVEVRVTKSIDEEGIDVAFIDDGPPIPEEELARIFDPFYVRMNQPEELGINLLACYLTVFQHGGMICAKQAPDGRNSILFSLPCIPNRSSETEGLDSAHQTLWRLADFSDRDARSASAALSS